MLKKTRIFAVIGIFAISFLCHFLFDWFPNILSSIFFPVNESIWEHMKIIFTSTLLYSIVDKIILDKKNIEYNNFYLQAFVSAFFGIVLYLLIYLPLYSIFGENMFISIALLLIVYSIKQYISYKLMKKEDYNIPSYIFIILIIIVYSIFTYLTYNPIENYIFYDHKKEVYGIKKD